MGQNYIDITDQGGSTSIDNLGPLNQAIQAARSQGRNAIYLPGQGEWNISAAPNDLSGITLFGDCPSNTILVANYSGDCIIFNGAGGMGGGIKKLTLWRGVGYSGGAGVKLVGNNSSSPDYAVFEDFDITHGSGGGSYDYPLVIDGTQRTTIQGVRDVKFRNVNLFCGMQGAASLQNIVGCGFSDLSCYPAGGSAAGLFIGGGSSTNFFDGANVQDQLNITHASQIIFQGLISSLNTDSTGSRCHLTGLCSAGPITTSNLQSSYVNFN